MRVGRRLRQDKSLGVVRVEGLSPLVGQTKGLQVVPRHVTDGDEGPRPVRVPTVPPVAPPARLAVGVVPSVRGPLPRVPVGHRAERGRTLYFHHRQMIKCNSLFGLSVSSVVTINVSYPSVHIDPYCCHRCLIGGQYITLRNSCNELN